ncbi:MAG: oligopeptidase B, partial [Microbacterium sp.]
MTSAPSADRRPTSRAHHGHTFDDPYEWLRAKDDPEVIAHLEAENAHTDAALSHLAPVRERIFDEIRSRVKESDLSVPSRRGQWWYYGRTVAGKQYGIQCRAPLASPDDWTP